MQNYSVLNDRSFAFGGPRCRAPLSQHHNHLCNSYTTVNHMSQFCVNTPCKHIAETNIVQNNSLEIVDPYLFQLKTLMLNEYEPVEKISRLHPSCNSPLVPINSTMRWLEESYFFRMQQVHMNDEMQLQGGIILNTATPAELPFATSFFTLSGNSTTSATLNQNSDHNDQFNLQSNPQLLYKQHHASTPSFQELTNFSSAAATGIQDDDERNDTMDVNSFLVKNRQHNFRSANKALLSASYSGNSGVIGGTKPYYRANAKQKQSKQHPMTLGAMRSKRLPYHTAGLSTLISTGNRRYNDDDNNSRFSDYKYIKRRQAPTLATGRKSKDDQLPPEEEEKRRLRRDRNKIAAAKCRQRRADLTKKLEMESDSLTINIQRLRREILQLSSERNKLHVGRDGPERIRVLINAWKITAPSLLRPSSRFVSDPARKQYRSECCFSVRNFK
ncbi:hypothetical protein GJ496_007233 [Pomphorhynchus laevis]|nr:hypothetical protein GJ496_007233 [Pomphorhynchus laevis]